MRATTRFGMRRRGFTIVELLVSLVILGVGLIGLLQLYMAATVTYQKGRCLSLATGRVQQELEKVHHLGYTGLMTNPLIHNTRYPASEYTALTGARGVQFDMAALPNGHGTITIGDLMEDGAAVPNIAVVTLEITWDGVPAAQSKVVITTMKAGPTPGGSTP